MSPEPSTTVSSLHKLPSASDETHQSDATEAARGASLSRPHVEARSAFVPLTLGLLALFVSLGFQTLQLFDAREALRAAHLRQQAAVDTSGRLRASLDALAADTQRLADAGNASARTLVDELRHRGITINPQANASATTPLQSSR